MALFNKYFQLGFLHGINSWFTPTFAFCNPVRSWGMFNYINVFSCLNMMNCSNNYSYNLPETPAFNLTNDAPPILNRETFKVDNSVWNNYKFDFSQVTKNNNFDRFDFSNLKNTEKDEAPSGSTDTERATSTESNKNNNSDGTIVKKNVSYGNANAKFGDRNKHSKEVTGTVNHKYVNKSKAQAEAMAKKDENLEDLRVTSKNYDGWKLNPGTFNHDITFAKKGVSAVLQKASEMTGYKFIINSALGTGEGVSPHVVGTGYTSHHNAENPKLDISLTVYDKNGNTKKLNAHEMARILWNTGLFCHILEEPKTNHLDVQIDPAVLT
ncbi:hypothetical protein IKQ21_09665 [bacterium]|nr:hypothetical protein [bacterium]